MNQILLIDLDGTTFNNHQRDHLIPDDPTRCENWNTWAEACDTDTPINEWIAVIETLAATRMYTPIFLTSRPETCRGKTEKLIKQYMPMTHSQIPMGGIIMRQSFEHQTPAEFKRLHVNAIGPKDIALAIDDNQSVCKMMIDMGIPVLNVNPKKYKLTKEAIFATASRMVRKSIGLSMVKHFDVELSEVLVDEYEYEIKGDEYLSFSLVIKGKEGRKEFEGFKCFIQIDYHYENEDNVFQMIIGEDTEVDITNINVLGYMFCNEACQVDRF